MTSCDYSTASGLVFIPEVLDVLVEKIQGTENDDIAVLLLGYEEWPHTKSMHHQQNPKNYHLQSQWFKTPIAGSHFSNASEPESRIGSSLPLGNGFPF